MNEPRNRALELVRKRIQREYPDAIPASALRQSFTNVSPETITRALRTLVANGEIERTFETYYKWRKQ